MSKIVLITGASSGIGKSTAKHLAANGYTVYGAARRTGLMNELKNAGIKLLEMDVTDEQSVKTGIDTIIRSHGKIDILINNAGFGSYGALEEVSITDAKYQMEVNVFGAMNVTKMALPFMIENNYGKIVNISSIGGKVASPLGGWYHASKFAMEALSDSLRNEVRDFGVDVIVIEPGGIKTEWGGIAADNLLKVSGDGRYAEMAHKFADTLRVVDSKFGMDPIVIAQLIEKALTASQPEARYAAGFMAEEVLEMRKHMSDRELDKVLTNRFEINQKQ